MATRTIANGGGNWSSNSTWVEGAAPTSSDAVVATATSGNVTIDTTTCVCSTMVLTNYVGTMTFTSGQKLTVTTTVTFASGMTIAGTGTLQLSNTATITSNGVTFTGSLYFDAGTWTLADNWTVSGSVTFSNGSQTINGSSKTMTIGGSITGSGASSTIQGTANFIMNGTGNIAMPGSLSNGLTINTAGTITFTGNNYFGGGTGSLSLTYTAGTVITTSSVVGTVANFTFNTNGITFARLFINSNTLTIQSDLSSDIIDNATGGNFTISGNYNITVNTLEINLYNASRSFIFQANKTLTVNNNLYVTSHKLNTTLYTTSIVSSSASTAFNLVYNGTLANCKLFGVIFTDCDASGSSVPLFNWCGGTLTRTSNIYNVDGSNYPAVADVESGVSYANGAYTGTLVAGGTTNDVFGVM